GGAIAASFKYGLEKTRRREDEKTRALLRDLGTHEVVLRLALVCPARLAVGAHDEVLFLGDLHLLVVPLRDRRRGLQLRGEPHAGDDLAVAAPGDAVLIVPEPEDRTGAM